MAFTVFKVLWTSKTAISRKNFWSEPVYISVPETKLRPQFSAAFYGHTMLAYLHFLRFYTRRLNYHDISLQVFSLPPPIKSPESRYLTISPTVLCFPSPWDHFRAARKHRVCRPFEIFFWCNAIWKWVAKDWKIFFSCARHDWLMNY